MEMTKNSKNIKSLTILVNAYNEEKNIIKTLDKIANCINKRKDQDITVNIMVIDDGSNDSTAHLVKTYSSKFPVNLIINPKNLGMGASIKKGIKLANSKKIALVPGDNDLPESLIQKSIDFSFHADIVSFYLINDEIRGPLRYFISKIHNLVYCIFFNQYLIYFNGPKVYPLDKLKKINLVSKKFALIPEMSIKLLRMGVSYVEIPSQRLNDDNNSSSLSFLSLFEAFYIFIFCLIDVYIINHKKYSQRSSRVIFDGN